ncbi:hypothetical protein B9Z65_2665 [Elsinoe australis]|uniref:Uncharacterized protein n=1 Tax=Elsinoe australis TaxID=40998 RepID=A0A2P8A489_9PEZI|nr:hypothetical protein B9Z65_2665 [Elsinoe australis]
MRSLLSFAFVALASCAPQASTPTGPADPTSTACGDLVRQANGRSYWFYASEAIACLQSVPFNAAVANRYLRYINTTVQYQSSLSLLKDPPDEYQQPGVDIQASFEQIEAQISQGYYQNQFAFESDLQRVLYDANDAHLAVFGGIFNVFTFGNERSLISVSPDGIQPPRVYLASDLYNYKSQGWQPSPIRTIDGQDVIAYLTEWTDKQSIGMIERHADWNQAMVNAARDVQRQSSTFGGTASFYPGNNITFGFDNQTSAQFAWLAQYYSPGPTGPLETGGDMYNFFVLGYYPASFQYTPDDADEDTDTPADGSDSAPLIRSWGQTKLTNAYPNADVWQANLGAQDGGVVTGYMIPQISTAVLSIPSFAQSISATNSFKQAVDRFIALARRTGMTKCIIDLQQNSGGDVSLAIDTFKRFFPDEDPFTGSRRRKHAYGDLLGNAYTNYWNGDQIWEDDDTGYLFELFAGSEWVISTKDNPITGQNFTLWPEYSPPTTQESTLTETYNLSNPLFINGAFQGFEPFGYLDNSVPEGYSAPFRPENIVLLTDGQCASACALFAEYMVSDGGVRTVVVGGRPEPGPMQAVSGTRSAASYSAENLEQDFYFAGAINDTVASQGPADYDTDVLVSYAGISLRDQVRANETTPLQFQYLAADCRIYYTLDNWSNYTRLWVDTAAAASDPSRCIAGSTGFSKRGRSQPDNPAPRRPSRRASYIAQGLALPTDEINTSPDPPAIFNPEITANSGQQQTTTITACSDTGCSCGANTVRRSYTQSCPNGYSIVRDANGVRQRVRNPDVKKSKDFCVPRCNPSPQADSCPLQSKCSPEGANSGNVQNIYAYSTSSGADTNAVEGRCIPYSTYVYKLACNPGTTVASKYSSSIGKRGLEGWREEGAEE